MAEFCLGLSRGAVEVVEPRRSPCRTPARKTGAGRGGGLIDWHSPKSMAIPAQEEKAMSTRLEQLADRMDIQDLLIDYCTAVDQGEIDRFDELFTPDAWIDYTAMGGEKGSLEEIKSYLKRVLPTFARTQHMIANCRIWLEGDTARARTLCHNPMVLAGERMDSEEPPNVRVACSGDIDEVVRLMHDAAAWMSAKGTPAWDVARIDRTFAETFVLRSELLVAS